jgi:hypothetical protein
VDVIGSLRKPVIKDASALVVFVNLPVDAPPAVFPAQGAQSLYERAARAFSARSRRDEKVLQIANQAKTPGMGVENVVGESDGFTFWAECEQGTDRLARRKDTLPEPIGHLIGNTTTEFRTISLPEAEPVRASVASAGRISIVLIGRRGSGVIFGAYPKFASSTSGAAYRGLVQQQIYDLGYNIFWLHLT